MPDRIKAQHDPCNLIPRRILTGGVKKPEIRYEMRLVIVRKLLVRRCGISNRCLRGVGQRVAVPATSDGLVADLPDVWNTHLPLTRARSTSCYASCDNSDNGWMTRKRDARPAWSIASVCREYSVVEYSTRPCCLVNGDTRGAGAQPEEASTRSRVVTGGVWPIAPRSTGPTSARSKGACTVPPLMSSTSSLVCWASRPPT